MSSFDLRAVRAGLAGRLELSTELARVYPTLVDSASVTELPAAFIGLPSPVLYSTRFGRGATELVLTVTVVVARTDVPAGIDLLDGIASQLPTDESEPYVGLVDAVHGDRTLGGACSTCAVERGDNARTVSIGELEYLALDYSVRIHT